MNRILHYVLAATRGGMTRIEIINSILDKPQNANQLSKSLNLDYKTIQHHIRVLQDNRIIVTHGKYGAIYFLAPEIKKEELEEIWDGFGKTNKKDKGKVN